MVKGLGDPSKALDTVKGLAGGAASGVGGALQGLTGGGSTGGSTPLQPSQPQPSTNPLGSITKGLFGGKSN